MNETFSYMFLYIQNVFVSLHKKQNKEQTKKKSNGKRTRNQSLKGDTYFAQYFCSEDIDIMCENIRNDLKYTELKELLGDSVSDYEIACYYMGER